MIIHGDGTSLWTITHNSDFVATNRADQGIRETIEYVLAHPEMTGRRPGF